MRVEGKVGTKAQRESIWVGRLVLTLVAPRLKVGQVEEKSAEGEYSGNPCLAIAKIQVTTAFTL